MMRQRDVVLALLRGLPQAVVAEDGEVLRFIDAAELAGAGIGYVDALLLAAVRLGGDRLWTRDRGLSAVADRLGLA